MIERKLTCISMVGPTASGKSTLAAGLARYLRTAHVEGSDVIKELVKDEDRAVLADTITERLSEDPDWFGRELSQHISRGLAKKNGRKVFVVSGVRNIETAMYLRKNYYVYAFEVRAEMPVRYERCLEDGKYISAHQFLMGEIREHEMGLQQVLDDAPFAIPTSPFTNPERIIKATAKLLLDKGAALR